MKRIFVREAIGKVGEKVLLKGWVRTRRDHGKIIFVDLWDMTGPIQCVVTPESRKVHELASTLSPECIIAVTGLVKNRPPKMANPKIASGKVEVEVKSLEVINWAKTPPFPIDQDTFGIGEEIRLKYRYLDLRTARMQRNLKLRQEVIHFIRNFLHDRDFYEIETPILSKSTPEGARDFVVPSRNQPGKFYALPQSPQQYKQLLMVAGFERYFQIPRCFRDEDPRADRTSEFTQLDLEMSFVTQEEILAVIEELLIALVKEIFPEKKITKVPFPQFKYQKVIEKYQTDKPDLRQDKNNKNELSFVWIVDFPMFEYKPGEKRWGPMHHPFTAPYPEDLKYLGNKAKIKEIRAQQYDLVLNGFEIGGGSIRTHDTAVLEEIFKFLGYSKKEIQEKFGHLFEAFQYGVPPHGGIALGLDRLIAVLAGEYSSVREVIAFPKTGDGRDPMMNSPSPLEPEQLKELKLKIEK